MNIRLIKMGFEYKDQLIEMIDEWKRDIEENHTNHSPYAIFKNDPHNFEYYIDNLDDKGADNKVPSSTFFCLDIDKNRLVGAVNIRHYLNDNLLLTGGHIGDGIRPKERRKGYGSAMIGLALDECRKLGIRRVLMCCSKNNTGSQKTIINNGGVLENEVLVDEETVLRYWIEL